MGKTFVCVANGTSGMFTITADSPCMQYRIWAANTTPQVYLNMGQTVGNAVAAVPVAGTPAYGMPLNGGTSIVLTGQMMSPNATIALISGGGANVTAQVWITPGEGFRV